jgi:sialate O-acetylesterase
MFELTSGIPQGVIPTAVGGAPITKWLPISEGENYYTAAIRRIVETGSNIKGVFWAQGEGDADAKNYPAKIESIRKDLCKILDKSEIPFVQMQSFKCTINIGDENTNKIWSNFREMQRNMPFNTNNLATIATNDLELDDLIHLSSDSQKIAGKRAANAMYYLLTGCGYAEPEIDKVYITKGRYVPQLFSEIHIRYKNTAGSLKASGVPFGFAIKKTNSNEEPSIKNIKRIFVAKNEVIISVEIPSEQLKDYELWYGYGNDFYCNITDGEGRAIPSMGPILLKR